MECETDQAYDQEASWYGCDEQIRDLCNEETVRSRLPPVNWVSFAGKSGGKSASMSLRT